MMVANSLLVVRLIDQGSTACGRSFGEKFAVVSLCFLPLVVFLLSRVLLLSRFRLAFSPVCLRACSCGQAASSLNLVLYLSFISFSLLNTLPLVLPPHVDTPPPRPVHTNQPKHTPITTTNTTNTADPPACLTLHHPLPRSFRLLFFTFLFFSLFCIDTIPPPPQLPALLD
ncbi:hypothetical protein IWX90DRAFT_317965 [Phyllosticta citrichinensis]|uniref:Uncharacterized protein n=1 Tax=Phyllosticta citrichinensis TaxID=1130410 RepID=A0ABR1XJB7_9PEZI